MYIILRKSAVEDAAYRGAKFPVNVLQLLALQIKLGLALLSHQGLSNTKGWRRDGRTDTQADNSKN
jgi:hypothetical protein